MLCRPWRPGLSRHRNCGLSQWTTTPGNESCSVAQVRRVFTAADETVLYLGEVTYRGDYIQFEMDLRL